MEYIIEKYGHTSTFTKGQKVMAGYYHEYERSYMKDAYKRTFWERLIDPPFKPVKFGVIIGDAGVHPFWLGQKHGERYLLVKFKEYRLAKPIPMSCLEDAVEFDKKTKASLVEMERKLLIESPDVNYKTYLGFKKWSLMADEALKSTKP